MNTVFSSSPKKIAGLHPNVFLLGLVSLLTDVSSEMIFTLMPLFLANVLAAAPIVIGLITGVSDGIASIMKLVSGWISDKIGKRKWLAFAGYGISNFIKPVMYFASSWGIVFGIRFADRFGKGIRTAPRDALIADSLASTERGKGFGLHQAMDSAGAAIGLLFTAVIIYFLQQNALNLEKNTYQLLVVFGIIPGMLALIVFFFIHDRRHDSRMRIGITEAATDSSIGKQFMGFIIIMFLFTLGNSSDAFLILRAQNLGSCVLDIALMLLLFNIAYASVSLPAGLLSDRIGRKKILIISWLNYAAVYLGFAVASSAWQVWLLFGLYGVYYGLSEGVARAFIADLVPEGKRGTAYGIFHGTIGLTLLPAGLIAGWLWQSISPSATFYFGAGLSCIAMTGLFFFIKDRSTLK